MSADIWLFPFSIHCCDPWPTNDGKSNLYMDEWNLIVQFITSSWVSGYKAYINTCLRRDTRVESCWVFHSTAAFKTLFMLSQLLFVKSRNLSEILGPAFSWSMEFAWSRWQYSSINHLPSLSCTPHPPLIYHQDQTILWWTVAYISYIHQPCPKRTSSWEYY